MTYEPQKFEEGVLEFWREKKIYEKAKKKVLKGKKYFFLDGPPYTSGRFHLGQFWNYALKDMLKRYKRMCGYNVWNQPGLDTHGLPTETKVEKKYGIKNKKELMEKFTLLRFIKACQQWVKECMEKMKEDQKRWGIWFDIDSPYATMQNSYIESVWWSLKECWKKKLLYEGKKVLGWCPRCATALAANYEIVYHNTKENSIFVKFPLKDMASPLAKSPRKGGEKTSLVIWTTTPWTLPSNMAVMVHPELDYVKAESEGEYLILAKGLAAAVVQGVFGKKMKVVKEFKGRDMEGWEYKHIFEEEVPFHKKIKHKVVLSEDYVDLSAGSGLVHCAPGCGPEDFEVGQEYDIAPFNPVDENGVFGKEGGEFEGFTARADDPKIVKVIEEKGLLLKQVKIEHDYPFCERCESPIIFRATKQWFLKVTKLKEKMLSENEKTYWSPDWAGHKQFHNWLANIRDWCITRQRFWGIPFPLWTCKNCDKKIVIGSTEEIRKMKGKVPKDLHKPWLDKVKLKCECGGDMNRIPDVVDVWIDAAAVSFASLGYPKNKKLFEEWWPADVILEAKDQIRGWFYALIGLSACVFNKSPYKSVYMYGWTVDESGQKFSKRLGNTVPVEDVIAKVGSDCGRLYLITSALPGIDSRFIWNEQMDNYKALNVFWNIHNYIIRYSKFLAINPFLKKLTKNLNKEEEWLLSKTNSLVFDSTRHFELLELPMPGRLAKNFFLNEMSRWYIQLVRDKLVEKRWQSLAVLAKSYLTLLKLLAPIIPLTTEKIYQELKKEFGLAEESVHFYEWPKPDKKHINKELELEMELAQQTTQAVLYAREKAKIGRRWPLPAAFVIIKDNKKRQALEKIKATVLEQTNIKELRVMDKEPFEVKESMKLNHKTAGPRFASLVPKIETIIAQMDARKTKNKMDKKGCIKMRVGRQELELAKEDIIFEIMVPENLEVIGFEQGVLYLLIKQTKELIEEGFSNEVVRRIQELRKKAGLKRTDYVKTVLVCDGETQKMLKPHLERIKRVTESRELCFEESLPKTGHKQEFTIKGKNIGATVIP